MANSQSRDLVKILMLISGIMHILSGVIWMLSTLCFSFFISIPVIILGIFEILFFANKADNLSPEEFASKAKVYGILDIVAGVLQFNPVPIVLGIINLVTAPKVIEESMGNQSPGFAPVPPPGAPMPPAGQPMGAPGQPMQPAPPMGAPGQPMPPMGAPVPPPGAPMSPVAEPAPPVDAPIEMESAPAPPADPAPPVSPEAIDPPAAPETPDATPPSDEEKPPTV